MYTPEDVTRTNDDVTCRSGCRKKLIREGQRAITAIPESQREGLCESRWQNSLAHPLPGIPCSSVVTFSAIGTVSVLWS